MLRYCGSVWDCRWFWLSLVRADLRTRYRRSFLGLGWSLLHPIAMTIVLCTVFHGLFDVAVEEYAPYLLTGLCFWNALTAIAIGGCGCLYQAENYIRQHPAPLAIYPLRTVLGAGFHFLVALLVAVVLTWSLRGFDNVAALYSIVPALVILVVAGWSLAVLTGIANVYFPDTLHLVEVVLQLMFYATPIIYPPRLLADKGLGWLVSYNPLANLVQLLRAPILDGQPASAATYAIAVLATLAILGAATLALKKLERSLIFHM
ncbi:MAG: ABC transporter permease [Planctomycetes bacterium]|nr:ABC transporter permease [Planctomycetota bacterium]